MLIGELSKRAGLSRDTIRFYEKQGLIKLGRRERRVNNYKEYSDDVLRRLLLFKKIKSYGFTLNESADLIALIDNNLASCNRVANAAEEKIAVIDKKIEELKTLKTLIRNSIENCEGRCAVENDEANCPLFEI
ncbi:MAG TPA: MerR family transcriptional regulator [Chitinophagaceae bacterium]|jgi:DNA-binding transcriptional MerR regulator|nr:MerR family transcriptional regulator [Chitinophagaceae bacterium]